MTDKTYYFKPVNSVADLPQHIPLWRICLKLQDAGMYFEYYETAVDVKKHLEVSGRTVSYLCETPPEPSSAMVGSKSKIDIIELGRTVTALLEEPGAAEKFWKWVDSKQTPAAPAVEGGEKFQDWLKQRINELTFSVDLSQNEKHIRRSEAQMIYKHFLAKSSK